MALANGNENEDRFRSFLIASQDGPPLPDRAGNVELYAATETSPVVAFLFAAPQPLEGHAIARNLCDHRLDHGPRRPCAANEILSKNLVDHANFEARASARTHCRLPLAVG